jgi:uncharacterized membrane protein
LSRILIRWIGRVPPAPQLHDPPHVLRVVLPWISFEGLLDTAFEQIRHYAANDLAVSMRLLRAFSDIASTIREPNLREVLAERAKGVIRSCEARLTEQDLARLRARSELAPFVPLVTTPI